MSPTDPAPADSQLERPAAAPDELYRKAFGELAETFTPWFFEFGSWIFGGLIAFTLLILALSGLLAVIGMVAVFWHMAWWIALAFLAMVLLSLVMIALAMAAAQPRDADEAKAQRRRSQEQRRRAREALPRQVQAQIRDRTNDERT